MSTSTINAVIFDLDGTIYVGNQALPGAIESIKMLRSMNKRIFFFSNTSIRTRQEVIEHLSTIGIAVDLNEVITAAYLSAKYLQKYAPDSNVYVIGNDAVKSELNEHGINVIDHAQKASHVLVGLDKFFTYEKLNNAARAVRNGATLIGINPDPYCPVEDQKTIPDTGALLKAIECASEVSSSIIIGKPSLFFVEQLVEHLGITEEECLMVGDRIETDILFGNDANMKTLLVLTGVAREEDVETSTIKPTYVLSNLTKFINHIFLATHK
ncbi:HAD-IIA family hydrolase [Bacillus sp. AK128]